MITRRPELYLLQSFLSPGFTSPPPTPPFQQENKVSCINRRMRWLLGVFALEWLHSYSRPASCTDQGTDQHRHLLHTARAGHVIYSTSG